MDKLDLAKKTTMLAAVRTLLSYIRTSLVCVSVALAFIKLDKQNPIDAFTIVLFAAGALFLIVGVVDYWICKKSVDKPTE